MPTDPTSPDRFGSLTLHPSWSDLRFCRTDATETEHRSAVTALVTKSEMWEATLFRVDEHTHPDEAGGLHVRLDVASTEMEIEVARHEMPIEEVPELARWLMGLFERAVFASTAVAS